MVVDGNDVQAVRAVAETAVERARAGEGPTLIEAKTFRVRPHSASTPTDARPEELIATGRSGTRSRASARCCAASTASTPRRLEAIDRGREAEIEAAVEFAMASPAPDASGRLEDVYAPADWQRAGRLA